MNEAPSIGVVVSHCDEDLSWLSDLAVPEGSSLRVLEKCGMETELEPLVLGNGGRFGDVERSHLPNLAMESLGTKSVWFNVIVVDVS